MKLYTSYFANIKNIHLDNAYFISIAGKTPNWFQGNDSSKYMKFSFLAPLKTWWKEWHDRFEENLNSIQSQSWYKQKYYETVLIEIDFSEFIHKLNNIDPNGNFVFMCYETPNKFCHRHLLSDWIKLHGVDINELS